MYKNPAKAGFCTFVISFVKLHVKCFLDCADLFLNMQLFAAGKKPANR